MNQPIQFQDVQYLIPTGRHVGNKTKISFDVLDGKDQFLYREEWDQERTTKFQQQIGFPVIVSIAKRTHLWHRFTYFSSESPEVFLSFCLIYHSMQKNFQLIVWIYLKQDNGFSHLDFNDLTDEQRQEWRSILKKAESFLLEDNHYRLLTVTGELQALYSQ